MGVQPKPGDLVMRPTSASIDNFLSKYHDDQNVSNNPTMCYIREGDVGLVVGLLHTERSGRDEVLVIAHGTYGWEYAEQLSVVHVRET